MMIKMIKCEYALKSEILEQYKNDPEVQKKVDMIDEQVFNALVKAYENSMYKECAKLKEEQTNKVASH